MNRYNTLADLFMPEPAQWGLRGDPHLWRAMRVYFAETPLPTQAAELAEKVEQAFWALSGQPLATAEKFYVEEFAHGGMSSGYIWPEFWREQALPLLQARLAAAYFL